MPEQPKWKIFVGKSIKTIILIIVLPILFGISLAIPPLGVYFLKRFFSAQTNGTFDFFSREPVNRADTSENGHVSVFYETGYGVCMIISILLTLFGYFPGVFFIFVLGFYNILLSYNFIQSKRK